MCGAARMAVSRPPGNRCELATAHPAATPSNAGSAPCSVRRHTLGPPVATSRTSRGVRLRAPSAPIMLKRSVMPMVAKWNYEYSAVDPKVIHRCDCTTQRRPRMVKEARSKWSPWCRRRWSNLHRRANVRTILATLPAHLSTREGQQ